MADILGHATDAVPKEQLNASNLHLKNLYEGLTMTKGSLMQVFKRHGLEQVNPLNEKFNPNLHEALFQKVNKKIILITSILDNHLSFFFNLRNAKMLNRISL